LISIINITHVVRKQITPKSKENKNKIKNYVKIGFKDPTIS
jgi:hypothetical protein